ncbi:MAG: hypothetical protein F6K65_40745 [Moorea sp. SIO3C2]|nr:hypothetical protein [Moorena sp. SIO3C2]
MNGGNTPGYLLKKIKNALCSAFPSEIKLAMMLDYQFSINLEEIARGGDLTDIVYKVVKDFKTRNSLENLLDGALNENPDNLHLKAIKEEFKITTSLINLLLPLENNFFKQMQQAYQACCPNNLWDDWEDELPDSFYEILKKLDDIPQATNDQKRIVKSVDRLL